MGDTPLIEAIDVGKIYHRPDNDLVALREQYPQFIFAGWLEKETINEGNEDALFGFVTLLPLNDSNIKETTQFIDEIETDSPVPFNVPIEFVGEPRYGEHDVKISVRYKDSVRDERFEIYETTIFLEDLSDNGESGPDFTSFIALAAVAGIGGIVFTKFRKRKRAQEA